MSRLLLLIPLLTWLSFAQRHAPSPIDPSQVTLFLLMLLGPIVLGRLWITRVLRLDRYRAADRFPQLMSLLRLGQLGWFCYGVSEMGWGDLVMHAKLPLATLPIETPHLLLAIAPLLLAWAGTWWASYPLDRAMREQMIYRHVDDGLPVHAPPTAGQFVLDKVRQQLLLTLAPILTIFLLRDAMWLGLQLAGIRERTHYEWIVYSMSLAIVIAFSPEILRRVLPTEPLPDTQLRQTLSQWCKRLRLRERGVLLWRTRFSVANAVVMGPVPYLRYVLLSDLLLETLSDRQIEAVFAHEAGHIRHHHIAWYLVLFGTFIALLDGPAGDWMFHAILRHTPASTDVAESVVLVGVLAVFLLLFGVISRRFERQADVFAARALSIDDGDTTTPALAVPVRDRGAQDMSGTLLRVAFINKMSLRVTRPTRWRPRPLLRYGIELAGVFYHGSIETRLKALQTMSLDPARTSRFDWSIRAIKLALAIALLLSVTPMLIPLVAHR